MLRAIEAMNTAGYVTGSGQLLP